MPDLSVDVLGVTLTLDQSSLRSISMSGAYTRSRAAFVPAQSAAYGSTPAWMPIVGAQITLEDMNESRGVDITLSGIVGRSNDGLVSFGVFRDGQLLDQVGAASISSNSVVVPVNLRWRDTTPLSGEHTYEFRWRMWSGSSFLGSRGDMNFVANVPSLMTLEEFIF
ncbi:hypothetical protein D3C85_1006260 [compost metagenome]